MYQRVAKRYDFAIQLYRLLGIRHQAYRARATELLRLSKGDSVVDLGCGTGLNFPSIIERIGPEGRLIGIDLTPEMLVRAQERVERSGWRNVELIQSDIAVYDFPEEINGVLSTGVFGYIAEYDRVIKAAAEALVPGGRLVILDAKQPEQWPAAWILKLILWLSKPFGVTPDYVNSPPWDSVERYFEEATLEKMYGGGMYISSGTAPFPQVAPHP